MAPGRDGSASGITGINSSRIIDKSELTDASGELIVSVSEQQHSGVGPPSESCSGRGVFNIGITESYPGTQLVGLIAESSSDSPAKSLESIPSTGHHENDHSD